MTNNSFRLLKSHSIESYPIDVSIVLPIFNEAENLEQLFGELNEVIARSEKVFEVIAVNDGSQDQSYEVLHNIIKKYTEFPIKLVNFSRTFGQTAAMSCGFDQAHGKVIVPLDADLQNDPADIPRLLDELDKGFGVVSGWRRSRHDNVLRVIPSWIANRVINKLIAGTGVKLHDYGCTLKAYRRDVIKNIRLYGEMHRFIPAFAGWRGAKVGELVVNHRPRTAGVSKYGMGRIWRVLLDFITVRFLTDSFTKPLQFFGKIVIFLLQMLVFSLGMLAICDHLGWGAGIGLNSYLIVIGFFALAIQNLLVLGLLSEILIRTYFETMDKATYVIKDVDTNMSPEEILAVIQKELHECAE